MEREGALGPPLRGTRERFPWEQIERVDVQEGDSKAASGAVAGLLVGLVITGIAGASAEDDAFLGDFTTVLTTALVAIPLAAAFGAVIGGKMVEWRPVVCAANATP